MSKLYNLTISHEKTPHPKYLKWLKAFPGPFTEQEFSKYFNMTPREWHNMRMFRELFYDPREVDRFEDFRGETYFPDHGLNLVTGFMETDYATKSNETRAYRRALYRRNKRK